MVGDFSNLGFKGVLRGRGERAMRAMGHSSAATYSSLLAWLTYNKTPIQGKAQSF